MAGKTLAQTAAVVGLSLSLGICGGSWAGTRWLWTTIEQQIEALVAVHPASECDDEELRRVKCAQ